MAGEHELLTAVVRNAPVALFALDRAGIFTLSEGRALAGLGLKAGELVGQSVFEVCRDYPSIIKLARRALAGEEVTSVVKLGKVTFDARCYPVREPDGTVSGAIGMGTDITERVQTEQALKGSEARYHTLFEESRDAILIVNRSGALVDFNQAALDLFEYTRREFRHIRAEELHQNREEHARVREAIERQGAVRNYPVRLCKKSGMPMDCLITASVWRDEEEGGIQGYQGTIRDITMQKQVEEALRESEERYRLLVEFAPVPIVVHVEGKIAYVNTAAIKQLGAGNAEELIGRPLLELVHPDYRRIVRERIRHVQGNRQAAPPLVEKFIRLDGQVVDVEASAIPITYHGRRAVQVILHDITERLRGEKAQREQRILAEALRETVAAVNSTLDLSEVLEHILNNVAQVVPHDAATIMLVDSGAARVVGHRGYAERGLTESVEAVRYEVTTTPNLSRMAETRQPMTIVDVQNDPDWVSEKHTAWIHSYAGAPISLEGEVLGFINLDSGTPGFFTQTQAERLQTFADQAATAIRNARLYQAIHHHAEELEASNRELDAFSHTVAHDLKAPLHVIIGYASLLASDYADELTPEILGHLKYIETYGLKLNEMIESLLLFAKLRDAKTTVARTEIEPVVRAALTRFEDRIAELGVTVEISPDLPAVLAQGPWLEEVFANLIENAIKYCGKNNPSPRIAIRGRTLPGNLVRYEVQDNGIGIAPEHQKDLFQMFTRVHPGYVKGAGLGLSIVQRIISKLGGEVGLESEVGQGSTFWFILPAA